MIRHTRVLLAAMLREEARSAEVGGVIVPFGVIALLVIPMAIGIDAPLLDRVGPGMFWAVLLLFGLMVTQRHSSSLSPARRDLLQLLGVDPAARFAASAVASWILLIAFSAAAGAATVILYDPAMPGVGWMAALIPMAALGIALLGTLIGSLVGGVRGRLTLAPLLVVPAGVPILLGAAQATEGLRAGAGILRWILLLGIADTALALVGVLTARSLEEA